MIRKRPGESTPISRLIRARYKGICLCGRRFAVGDRIEFDPLGRLTRCLGCYQKQLRLSRENLTEPVMEDNSAQFARVERLKMIRALPFPLSPSLNDEYLGLLAELNDEQEIAPCTKLFLQSSARCKSKDRRLYAVKLYSARLCVHCRETQVGGSLVLMDFSKMLVHCILCECY